MPQSLTPHIFSILVRWTAVSYSWSDSASSQNTPVCRALVPPQCPGQRQPHGPRTDTLTFIGADFQKGPALLEVQELLHSQKVIVHARHFSFSGRSGCACSRQDRCTRHHQSMKTGSSPFGCNWNNLFCKLDSLSLPPICPDRDLVRTTFFLTAQQPHFHPLMLVTFGWEQEPSKHRWVAWGEFLSFLKMHWMKTANGILDRQHSQSAAFTTPVDTKKLSTLSSQPKGFIFLTKASKFLCFEGYPASSTVISPLKKMTPTA